MTSKSLRHSRSHAFTLAAATLVFSPYAQSESLVDSALRFFIGNDSNTPSFDLDKSRPAPVTADFKAQVVNSLPKEGRITRFNEPQRRKLESLDAILQLHQRQSVYEYTVFKSDPMSYAFIGLRYRAALFISDVALNLLDVEELQASVAHEIGHEYIWAEYLEAEKRNDEVGLKRLELICDGIAILTLRRAGINPAPLLKAAQKITDYNRLAGQPANAYKYPSADERKRFAHAICDWVDSRRGVR